MVDKEHIQIIKQGPTEWNRWRKENSSTVPNLEESDLTKVKLKGANLIGANLRGAKLINANLRGANLTKANLMGAYLSGAKLMGAYLSGAKLTEANLIGAYLSGAYLSGANLSGADLSGAKLTEAYLRGANLAEANLIGANLSGADLTKADLIGADLTEANLTEACLSLADLCGANLTEANLSGANLRGAQLVNTDVGGASLTGCRIYGISVWGLKDIPKGQSNLIITPEDEPVITVDNLEVAQFVYLLLNSPKIRDVIDTIAKKAVLILGSFKDERKRVLCSIQEELRKCDYLPIIFDFKKPARRNTAETISTLAHISKFIIADITDARSVSAELERIVPKLPSVPVQPLIHISDKEYGLFDGIKCYDWVLEPYLYDNQEMLLTNLKEKVIDPVEAKVREGPGST